MKKVFAVIFSVLLAAVPVGASANSGPMHWETSPSFSMTPLADSPISVSREDLSFSFSKQKSHINEGYSPEARVTASYQMKNPTTKPVKVQMAFPLIASLNDLAQMEGISITAGGSRVPFEVYPGSAMPGAGYSYNYYGKDSKLVKTSFPSFSQILSSISDKPAVLEKLKGKGKRYVLSFDKNEDVNMTTTFNTGGKSCGILTTGMNGFSNSGSVVQLYGYWDKDPAVNMTPISVVAFGDSVQPSFSITDHNNKTLASEKPEVIQSEEDADSYFKAALSSSTIYRAYPSVKFRSRLVASAENYAEASMSGGNPVFGEGGFSTFLEQQRIIVLAYEVTFPANSEKNIVVSYPMGGVMDVQKTQDPIYSYGYLLNPAKGWAGFQNLNIKVTPPENEPYVVSSSIPLTASKDGVYTAKLSSLPQNDLVFSIYSKSKTEPRSSSVFSWNPTVILITVVIIVLIAVMIAAGRLKGRE